MPEVSEVMDQALAEVKSLGGNLKAIHESVQKDLEQIRSEVEGCGRHRNRIRSRSAPSRSALASELISSVRVVK